MVEGDDGGQQLLDAQEAVAEALVVVDEVELVLAALELAQGPDAERQRLAEGALGELGHLDEIGPRLQLPVRREPARVEVVEDVEARQLHHRHPLVEHGVGLATEHLDVVAEIDQRLGEVAGVDALAADVGLAPVGEVGQPERCIVVGGVATSLLKTHRRSILPVGREAPPRATSSDPHAVSALGSPARAGRRAAGEPSVGHGSRRARRRPRRPASRCGRRRDRSRSPRARGRHPR
jgi:hypothetical protein